MQSHTIVRVCALLSGALLFENAAHAQCVNIEDCQLVWSDEFDGDAVDTTKWEFQLGDGSQFGIPGWGNNEKQWYTSNNATVADGVLTITAREEQAGNKNYTSSRLRTLNRGDWTYGRFEMRAKLPEGQGLWPAFWMLSSYPQVYGIWAASGEIDIMESIGSDPDRIFGTIHYGGSFPDNVFSSRATRLEAGTFDEWHTYAVEWRAGDMRWYLDGELYGIQTSWFSTGGPYPAPFDINFHLLLNLAVGGNLPGDPDATTVFPQTLQVDYVRVYQAPPDGVPGLEVVFDDMEHGNPLGNNWFVFNNSPGGGIIAAETGDLPPVSGGGAALAANYSGNGATGFIGGFGRTAPQSLDGAVDFSFWINPDADQRYTLQINLQEDDNANGTIDQGDDEFQFNCIVSPEGPCATAGGGWQRVSIPFDSFFDDGSFLNGGNGILDADGEGELINVVIALDSADGGPITFRTDYWAFNGPSDADGDGVFDSLDNCQDVPNADQRDTNADGFGNACDADLTGDCFVNFGDLGALRLFFFSSRADADF
ncbi:MAG: family 16 glycosylhydrolase, partial [Pseudomonadota bacterium]